MADDVIREERRETPIVARTDVLVVGGGPAGVCAAVTAAHTPAGPPPTTSTSVRATIGVSRACSRIASSGIGYSSARGLSARR